MKSQTQIQDLKTFYYCYASLSNIKIEVPKIANIRNENICGRNIFESGYVPKNALTQKSEMK